MLISTKKKYKLNEEINLRSNILPCEVFITYPMARRTMAVIRAQRVIDSSINFLYQFLAAKTQKTLYKHD